MRALIVAMLVAVAGCGSGEEAVTVARPERVPEKTDKEIREHYQDLIDESASRSSEFGLKAAQTRLTSQSASINGRTIRASALTLLWQFAIGSMGNLQTSLLSGMANS